MSDQYDDDTPNMAEFEQIEPVEVETVEPGPGRIGVEIHLPAPAVTAAGGEAVSLENVKKMYTELFGVAMTAEQTANVFQVAEKLGVRGDDGIWVLLMALENYQRLFLQAPWAVQSSVRAVLQEVREEASNAAQDAAAEVKKELVRVARKAAGTTGWRRHLPYIWVLVFGFVGYVFGQLTRTSSISTYIYNLLY